MASWGIELTEILFSERELKLELIDSRIGISEPNSTETVLC